MPLIASFQLFFFSVTTSTPLHYLQVEIKMNYLNKNRSTINKFRTETYILQ